MTTTPPEAPPEPGPGDGADRAGAQGPRVTRDEVRDLARLRRSATDRKVAGVAGGLARHLDIDPIIPRVLLVVLVFFGGAGILLYAAAWLVVPVEGTDDATVRLDDRSRSVALLVVGALAALALVGDSFGGFGFPWPLVVAGLVVLVVLGFTNRESRMHPWIRAQLAAQTAARPYADPPQAPAPSGTTATQPYPTHPEPGWVSAKPPAPAYPVPPRAPRRRGPLLFPYALAIIALGVGTLGIVEASGGGVADSAYPAVALGTCAVLLLVGAFWGRAGGLIALGLVAAVATAGATVAGNADAGSIEATPTSAAAVQGRYDLTFGEIDLDLTQVADLEALDGRTVEVEVEVGGRIEVTVPEGLDVVVLSSVDIGDRRVLGDRLESNADESTTIDGGPDAPVLTLDAQVAFGEIEIDRKAA